MTTFTIVIAVAIRRMRAANLTEEQAAAIVETFATANDEMATKGDIREIKAQLDLAVAQMMRWVTGMPVVAAAAGRRLAGAVPPGLAHRILFAGPPPYSDEHAWPSEHVDAWAAQSVGWLQSTFPSAKLVLAALHRDENSPHV